MDGKKATQEMKSLTTDRGPVAGLARFLLSNSALIRETVLRAVRSHTRDLYFQSNSSQ